MPSRQYLTEHYIQKCESIILNFFIDPSLQGGGGGGQRVVLDPFISDELKKLGSYC